MLFTEEYIELQKDLHDTENYGVGMNADECAMIVKGLLESGSVLDYGCGQGYLKRFLTEYEVEEYDPAIEGKDDLPARADIVVCSDVMEHIEPACLDDVLNHIRSLTKKTVIFVISTRPAGKHLSDGRNAHLIIENATWWKSKVEKYFFVDGCNERKNDVLIIGRAKPLEDGALLPIARIKSSTAVDNSIRNDNVRINSEKVQNRLNLNVQPHDRVAHLACFGPTLNKTWPLLSMAKAKGEDIFSVSGSHKFLIEKGVIPKAHMDCDPRHHKLTMLGEPHKEVEYWMASCVHPDYIDALKKNNVTLWHSWNGRESKAAFDIDPGHKMVVGGGSIGLRAMSLLYCLGYRNFEIHGMDGSFENGEHHAAEHLGKNHAPIQVKCKDRWFSTNAVMILYARYFKKQIRIMPGAKIKLHGDGLVQYMYKGD